MKKKLLGLMFGAALVLGACGGGGDDKANENADNNNANTGGETAAVDAEQVVQQSCIGCHGKNLEGASGPALANVGSHMTEEEIHDVIMNGRPGMPPGLIKGEQADAVAKWLAEQK